jgi:alpha-soluble NSF attachment protein
MQQVYISRRQTPSGCKSRVFFRHSISALARLTGLTIDKEAGNAFERAASIQTKNLNEPDEAANTLVEAFKVYKKTDPVDSARVLDLAINHYTSKGNLRRAATHKQNLAQIYEIDIGDQKKAIENYELAASWFESDNAEA